MTIVKAATIQVDPVLHGREGTVQKVVQKIVQLGKMGVQFVIFQLTQGHNR
jgi:nitrilase